MGQRLPAKDTRQFALLGVHGLATRMFKAEAIQSILASGELLKYKINSKSNEKSSIMKLAEVMIREIDRIQDFFTS
ncbi:hypothetical protein JDS91_27160 [Bacillus cereus]|uniref:hypothetical protein n=1 Tax=Bacillus cereus TaxID=1396 RepID=UPI0018F4584D|nr:hypothetical protein [Bacillus cereus]